MIFSFLTSINHYYCFLRCSDFLESMHNQSLMLISLILTVVELLLNHQLGQMHLIRSFWFYLKRNLDALNSLIPPYLNIVLNMILFTIFEPIALH